MSMHPGCKRSVAYAYHDEFVRGEANTKAKTFGSTPFPYLVIASGSRQLLSSS
jgi:hypothetical protein